jgi:hypothetical protein
MEEREIRALQAKIARLEARLAEVEDRPTARLHRLLVRLGASRRGRFSLGVFVALAAAVSYAAQISVPNTFTNGTPADASQVNANFSTLETESNAQDLRLAAVEAANFQSQIDDLSSALDSLLASGIALQNAVATNTTDIATNQAGIATNATGIGALETTFAGVSRAGDLLTFSGMNVQVVGGSGQTAGVNGLGNLIVGYNENNVAATRTGSHNLVVGYDHEYTSSGGLVAGWRNTVSGTSSSVLGGRLNTASENYSSVSGGMQNTAGGFYSVISGGQGNTTSANYSSISGGQGNTASAYYSSISGGQNNTTSADHASIGGGNGGAANGTHDWVAGGATLSGNLLTLSGMNVQVVDGSGTTDGTVNGLGNLIVGYNENAYAATRTGSHNLVVGPDHEYTSYAGLVGGRANTISGGHASVSGGWGNSASGLYSSISGGYSNIASDQSSSVNGGSGNAATGLYSSVSGGLDNTASGQNSSVSAGSTNTASGLSSSVSGGNLNEATVEGAAVSGGLSSGAGTPRSITILAGMLTTMS